MQTLEPSLLMLLQCKTDEEGRFSLSVSTCEQVTRLGQSTSFGFCRARRKVRGGGAECYQGLQGSVLHLLGQWAPPQ